MDIRLGRVEWECPSSPIAIPRPNLSHNADPVEQQADQITDLTQFASLNSDGYYMVSNGGRCVCQYQPRDGFLVNNLSQRNLTTEENTNVISTHMHRQDSHSNDRTSFSDPKLPAPANVMNAAERREPHRDQSVAWCRRCRELSHVQGHLKSIRGEVLATREQVNTERQLVLRQRSEMAITVSKLIQSSLSVSSSTEQASVLGRLGARVQELNRDLTNQEELVRNLEMRLGSLEHHMGAKEAELYETVFSLEPGPTEPEIQRLHEFSNSKSENGSLPSIVERYYDRAGDITVFKDRLADLEYEHRMANEARENEKLQGNIVTPTELVFMTSFFRERKSTIENYLSARQDAERLYRECLNAGHKVDAVEDEEDGRDIDHTRRSKNDTSYPQGWGSERMALELLLLGQVAKEERIEAWWKDTLKTGHSTPSTSGRKLPMVMKSIFSPRLRPGILRPGWSRSSQSRERHDSPHREERARKKDWSSEKRMRGHYSDPMLRKLDSLELQNLVSPTRRPDSVG